MGILSGDLVFKITGCNVHRRQDQKTTGNPGSALCIIAVHNFTSPVYGGVAHIGKVYKQVWNGSGGARNLERGVLPLVHEAHLKILGLPRPLPVTLMHS